MDQADQLLKLRDELAEWFKRRGGSVSPRGGEGDLQVIAPDGTELELVLRVVQRG